MMKQKITNNDRSFNGEKWNEILKDTSNFTKPKVIKGAIDKATLADLKTYIHEIMSSANEDYDGVMRSSIGSKLARNPNNQLIYSNPPRKDEALESWVERVFNGEKLGIFINACQNLHQDLKSKFSSILGPLTELIGMPVHAFDLALFMGNYGFTPFGFHKDPIGHCVIHFHLGPGEKKMYLFPEGTTESDLKNLIEDQEEWRRAYDKLIPLATEYIISTGDLFFMPENVFHVGNTTDFSIGITAWQSNPSYFELIYLLLQDLFEKELDQTLLDSKVELKIDIKGIDTELAHNILAPIMTKSQDSKFSQILEEILTDRMYGILSNGVFRSRSKLPLREYPADSESTRIQLKKPFQITYRKVNDMLKVYAKGYPFSMPYLTSLVNILEKLNSFETINKIELQKLCDDEQEVKELLDNLWIRDMIYYD